MLPIYIHVGQPKTGSSTLQRFLKNNRQKLVDSGYLYDIPSRNHQVSHQQLIHKILQSENGDREFQSFLAKQIENAKEMGCRGVIISSESLFFMPQEKLKNLLHGFEDQIHVYVYLRRQDQYLESAWKQWYFKDLSYQNFNDYVEKFKVPNYLVHLKKWENFSVPNGITVTPFEKKYFPDGLEKHFLTSLGIENFEGFDSNIDDDGWGENKGLSEEGLELAFQVRELANGNVHDHTIQYFINKHFKHLMKDHFTTYNLLSPEQRQKILKESQEVNQTIAQRYMKSQGELFECHDTDITDKISSQKIDIDYPMILKELMSIGIKQEKMLKELKSHRKTVK